MKEPSPEIQITVSFGRATCAPTAAGGAESHRPRILEVMKFSGGCKSYVGRTTYSDVLPHIRRHHAVRGFAFRQRFNNNGA